MFIYRLQYLFYNVSTIYTINNLKKNPAGKLNKALHENVHLHEQIYVYICIEILKGKIKSSQ